MNENEKKLHQLLVLSEITYNKKIGVELPLEWYSYGNDRIKIDILYDAIKNNIKVEDTDLFQQYLVERNMDLK